MQTVECLQVVVTKTGFDMPDSSPQLEDILRGGPRIRHYITEVGLSIHILNLFIFLSSNCSNIELQKKIAVLQPPKIGILSA